MYVRIDVTQEDIDAALEWRDHGTNDNDKWGLLCPVGRAATRVFGKPIWATPFALSNDSTRIHLCVLPGPARRLITGFDYKTPIFPISFDVEVVDV